MSAFQKFEVWSENVAKAVHDFDAAGDTLKVLLTNTAPNLATDEVYADISGNEVASGNGYTTGGEDAQNSVSRSGAVTSCVGVDITWTASGGAIGPFRYAVLYDDTPVSPAKPLIGMWDYGSSTTVTDTNTFTVDFSTEMFTIGA